VSAIDGISICPGSLTKSVEELKGVGQNPSTGKNNHPKRGKQAMNEEVMMTGATDEVFEDETLVCKECGNEFVFTAGEQKFYKEKGFLNKPKSCKACRDAKKNAGRAQREYFITTCAECGGEAKVTFQPSSDRPVYCSACFEARKNAQ
jgi:CxxC-x17-CxxC domain-containing protein